MESAKTVLVFASFAAVLLIPALVEAQGGPPPSGGNLAGRVEALEAAVATLQTDLSQAQGDISTNSTTIGQQQTAILNLSDVAWEPGVVPGDIGYTPGFVGIGTREPGAQLTVLDVARAQDQFGIATIGIAAPTAGPGFQPNAVLQVHNPDTTATHDVEIARFTGPPNGKWALITLGDTTHSNTQGYLAYNPSTKQMVIGSHFSPPSISIRGVNSGGEVGVGTETPFAKLHVVGDIFATGGIASSRDLKENISILSEQEATETLKYLNPVKFNYKHDQNGDLQLGFIAEEVPELVSTPERKGIQPFDIIAVLTKTLQVQQKTISTLEEKIKNLEAAIKYTEFPGNVQK